VTVDWDHPFWSLVHPEALSGCWLWHGGSDRVRKAPYGTYRGSRRENGGGRAHRVAYELARGPIPTGMVVRHTCDVTLCVNPDHLLIGTQQDNIADKVARNRQQRLRGEAAGKAKLTWEAARAIRAALAAGATQPEMASRHGVTQGVISKIARGASWWEPGVMRIGRPHHCRLCKSAEHTARNCPTRGVAAPYEAREWGIHAGVES
jgi:hypothetical protein